MIIKVYVGFNDNDELRTGTLTGTRINEQLIMNN